jgi:large subunit ribosomal protein L27
MIHVNLQLLAHKMGMGSTRNGRDSKAKRLGAKLGDGQFCTAAASFTVNAGRKFTPG